MSTNLWQLADWLEDAMDLTLNGHKAVAAVDICTNDVLIYKVQGVMLQYRTIRVRQDYAIAFVDDETVTLEDPLGKKDTLKRRLI